jgi:hypothetical protein
MSRVDYAVFDAARKCVVDYWGVVAVNLDREHAVVTDEVPWADTGSGFTLLFDAWVINWIPEASIQAISPQLQMSWGSSGTSTWLMNKPPGRFMNQPWMQVGEAAAT